MQESLIRLWRLEKDCPGQTKSWYLQNCRFHLQHCLASGRSVDSPKRANGDNRATIDGVNDNLAADGYHTNGELFESVSARDLVSALASHLKPREQAVLGGLVDGLGLRDIAVQLNLSYPTALKSRRQIAALSIRLGISPPLPYLKKNARQLQRSNGVRHPQAGARLNGNSVKRHPPLATLFRPSSTTGPTVIGRTQSVFEKSRGARLVKFGVPPSGGWGAVPPERGTPNASFQTGVKGMDFDPGIAPTNAGAISTRPAGDTHQVGHASLRQFEATSASLLPSGRSSGKLLGQK